MTSRPRIPFRRPLPKPTPQPRPQPQRSTPVQTRGPLIDSLVDPARTPQRPPGSPVTRPAAPRAQGTGNTGNTGTTTPPAPPPPATPAAPAGTQSIGGAVIPEGANLVRLTGTAGAQDLYYVEYEAYGVMLRWEIGTADDLTAVFGADAVTQFQQMNTLSQEAFDSGVALEMGVVDEILGATESLQTTLARDLREADR